MQETLSIFIWKDIKMSNEPDVVRLNGIKIFNGFKSSDCSGKKTPFLIGVAGGTASGKVLYI